MRRIRSAWCAVVLVLGTAAGPAPAATPLSGHYPPGQTGLRGAAFPVAGWTVTNFNRFFSNLELHDDAGNAVGDLDELRYANITMITWTSNARILGMTYGAMAGIPFATGNLNPSGESTASTAFGLGDVLLTPLSLSGRAAAVDYQLQFTLWSASGMFEQGGTKNRGAGFWSLVYSAGGVWYPAGDRNAWSVAAMSRFEQNFDQRDTGITPGDDVVVDWGVSRAFRAGSRPLDLGVSGFWTTQLSDQSGGPTEDVTGRYRYAGAGPEGSIGLDDHWAFRVRAHFEFAARNAVQGNNLWLILNWRP